MRPRDPAPRAGDLYIWPPDTVTSYPVGWLVTRVERDRFDLVILSPKEARAYRNLPIGVLHHENQPPLARLQPDTDDSL